MGFFRFRKSIRLPGGIRLNLGKRGLSASVGVRGARIGFGSRGAHASVGIPGSGLGYQANLGGPGRRERGSERVSAPSGVEVYQQAPRAPRTPMNDLRTVAIVLLAVLLLTFAVIAITGLANGTYGAAAVALFFCAWLVTLIVLLARKNAKVNRERADARQVALQAVLDARLDELATVFGADAAPRIMRGEFWQGMTTDMLLASIGPPIAVDEEVMRSKVKHTYKYQQFGANRFALVMELENGVVVGWAR